jgi:hypothetical protein
MFVRIHEPMVCPKISGKGCQMEIRHQHAKNLRSPLMLLRELRQIFLSPCATGSTARFKVQEPEPSRHRRYSFAPQRIGLNCNRIRREL